MSLLELFLDDAYDRLIEITLLLGVASQARNSRTLVRVGHRSAVSVKLQIETPVLGTLARS